MGQFDLNAKFVYMDALGIFVHKDNPVKSLSLVELDGIFSKTFKLWYAPREDGKSIPNPPETWHDLKVDLGPSSLLSISKYGRNAASGTYAYFKSKVLKNGDYRPNVKELPGTSGVIQGISTELAGIGYGSIGNRTSGVKLVPIRNKKGEEFFPTLQNCNEGKYPLSRFLYIYINLPPNSEPQPLVREFIKFVLSKRGQEIAAKDQLYTLPASEAELPFK